MASHKWPRIGNNSHTSELVQLLADKAAPGMSFTRPFIRKMGTTIKVDIVSDTICPW